MENTWDSAWESEASRAYWNTPDPYVVAFSEHCNIGVGDTVLDLGCGIGRHAILFAQKGTKVYAVDTSGTAIAKLTESAKRLNLSIHTGITDYLHWQSPIQFDYIIAFNVIYHGDFSHFTASIEKCYELLKTDGKLLFTCPSRRDAKYGNGRQIAAHTYESENSLHPGDIHYFTDEAELTKLLYKFNDVRIDLEEHDWDNNGVSQFASNYIVTAKKHNRT